MQCKLLHVQGCLYKVKGGGSLQDTLVCRGEGLELGCTDQVGFNNEDRRRETLQEGPRVSKGLGVGCVRQKGRCKQG